MKVLMCHHIFPQPEPTLAPCRPENTSIIRHVSTVHKIIYFFGDFLEKFGHSFADIEVGWLDAASCVHNHSYGKSTSASQLLEWVVCRQPMQTQLVTCYGTSPAP